MAGWSSPTYQSLHSPRLSGVRSMDGSARKEQLRSFFDQMLSSSLKDVGALQPVPIPVLLGDGSSVDLFKMYFAVKERGGYDAVTRDGSWASVSQELGFQSKFATPLKLVYAKYLGGMDRCFEGWAADYNSGAEMAGLKDFDLESSERKIVVDLTDGEHALKQRGVGKYGGIAVDVTKVDRQENPGRRRSISSGCGSPGKRKQESLVGLLNWLKVIAVNPCDPEKGRVVEGSPAKGFRVRECLARALTAREVRFHGSKGSGTDSDPHAKKKQRLHLSLYDDVDVTPPQVEARVRSSERLSSRKNRPPPVSPVSTTPAAKPRSKKSTKARASGASGVPSRKEKYAYHEPMLGADFQAYVPEWIGGTRRSVGSDASDSKWLGTSIWPPSGAYTSVVDNQIGKGWPSSCTCQIPGSVGCVKLHISEARLNLRHQLGSAFYNWRFDKMGEDVSVSWSFYDEGVFKSLIMASREGKSFWEEASLKLRNKSKRNIVSYYFNVFILRLRSVQNRTTPDSIDSDDNEYTFGPVKDDLTTDSSSSSD